MATVKLPTQIADAELHYYMEANIGRIVELFAPRHLIVFGSRVNGTARQDSDIDLIVVSDAFEGIPFVERTRRFNEQIKWHLRVDAWCYTVMEFERLKRQIGIVADACREGVWLLQGELLPDEEVNEVMIPEEQAHELMAQGCHELQLAKVTYDHDGYDTATFLAQQAAEKYLKALYLLRLRATPPRTHDLQLLALALGAPPEILDLGKPLTQDYTRTRYVDAAGMAPFKMFNASIAKERITQAEQIREWVLEQLGKGGAP